MRAVCQWGYTLRKSELSQQGVESICSKVAELSNLGFQCSHVLVALSKLICRNWQGELWSRSLRKPGLFLQAMMLCCSEYRGQLRLV